MAKIVESNGVPANDKVRKPTAKKSFSMKDFKEEHNATDIPDKPMKWIHCSDALKESVGIGSVPKGYVILTRGYTNTGKSTALELAIVGAQKDGILPIIIDTENNLGINRLKNMGFDMENDFYIMIDNEYLLENFGKKHDKNRRQAAIEDMAECINYFLDLQENGKLPYDLLFAVDSIGTLDCIKTINALEKDTSTNNQWNAGALSTSMKNILNNKIPNSRKINKEYTNTFMAVQKIWYDGMNGVIKHSGGESVFSATRYLIHLGGILTHGTSRVFAVSKGREVCFGTKVKINITKTHIDGDSGGISLNGEIISTPHGFINTTKESIDQYKKENILSFRNVLDPDVNVEDMETKYEESEEAENNHQYSNNRGIVPNED